jgi:hypothetical protein
MMKYGEAKGTKIVDINRFQVGGQFVAMANGGQVWTPEAEEAYRIHLAGYNDLKDYCRQKGISADDVERWETTGFIKKLERPDGSFYYYNQERECKDEDLQKIKTKPQGVPEK